MFLKKNIIWKIYNEKSVLYDTKQDKTLTLNKTSTEILKSLVIFKNDINKISMNLQIENPKCEYENLYQDVDDCIKKLLKSGFFTNNEEEATYVSLVGLESSLETASVEIVNMCDLECIHCYQGERHTKNGMLSIDKIRIIATKLGELGVLAIVLTGGEPFLHPELLDIVRIFNEENIRVNIFTNGQHIDQELLNKLSDMNVLVRISLEGPNKETNDFIRGNGSFEKALNFSKICREQGVDIGYSFTINTRNCELVNQMLQLAEDMEAAEIEMSELLNIRPYDDLSDLVLSEKQMRDFRINTLRGFAKSKAFRKGMGLYRHKTEKKYLCSAGISNIFIDINGDIYPCNLFKNNLEYCAGNILKDDLLELWRKSEVFDKLRNLNQCDIDGCENCEAKKNCKGGCRARALRAGGNINSKMDEMFCSVTKSLAKEIDCVCKV